MCSAGYTGHVGCGKPTAVGVQSLYCLLAAARNCVGDEGRIVITAILFIVSVGLYPERLLAWMKCLLEFLPSLAKIY